MTKLVSQLHYCKAALLLLVQSLETIYKPPYLCVKVWDFSKIHNTKLLVSGYGFQLSTVLTYCSS